MKPKTNLSSTNDKGKRICFFGHFGTSNFGNECTLQAALHNLRYSHSDARVTCICTNPRAVVEIHHIEAVPIITRTVLNLRYPRTRLGKLLRKVFVGVPNELCRYIQAFKVLKHMHMLVIVGTGLLTDVCGLENWGPYNLFRWSLMAKLRGCKVLFVSVGAGPLYTPLGRCFVRTALSLADFRSFRDQPSMDCIRGVGLSSNGDRVYPDLVFSLPANSLPSEREGRSDKRVVGLGLIEYQGKYSTAEPSRASHRAYLETLVTFVMWLLTRDYDIRLVTGDEGCDRPVVHEFKSLLGIRLGAYDPDRVVARPIASPQQLISQLAATDIVVATRFHNVLLALLLNKPVIAISFHHKCASLMSQMGLSEYCHDINQMNAGRLIEQFQDLERNAEKLKPAIRQKVEEARNSLEEQYELIFRGI